MILFCLSIHCSPPIFAQGSVPQLGKRIAHIARWIGYTEQAGNISIGLGVLSGLYNTATTCTGLESCARQTTIEAGGLLGGWGGGIEGTIVGGAVVASLGILSAPAVIGIVAGGALVGSIEGAGMGKDGAKFIYEFFRLDDFLKAVEQDMESDIQDEMEEEINQARFNNMGFNTLNKML